MQGVDGEAQQHHRADLVDFGRELDGSGDITLEDEDTGERCVATLYEPRAYGDVRTGAATPAERLRADPRAAALRGADVWAPPAAGPVVVPMPVAAAEARSIENPLPAGLARCRDLDEAWRVFVGIYPWPLSADQRERVGARFVELDLERAAIVDLAQRLVASVAQSTAAGGTG
jgi:hypothetical protein